MKPYPLVFSSMLLEKVWGGSAIELMKGLEHSQKPIGESWEIYYENIIANGEFSGRTLQSVIAEFPQEMIGQHSSNGEYPLLVKFLDAREWLSVQVHPDDKKAEELEQQSRGKTECWYILNAEPDAKIQYGFKHGTTLDEYAESISKNQDTELLAFHTVKKGDFIFVPAGAVHAIGPGITLYELQQTSDITYRLYDWGRMGLDGKPRELHTEKGLLCSDTTAALNIVSPENKQLNKGEFAVLNLIDAQYFSLHKIALHGAEYEVSLQNKAGLITNIGLESVQCFGDFGCLNLNPGTTCFLPSALDMVRIQAADEHYAELLFAQENQPKVSSIP